MMTKTITLFLVLILFISCKKTDSTAIPNHITTSSIVIDSSEWEQKGLTKIESYNPYLQIH